MPTPSIDRTAIAACHAEGLTVPETAARMKCSDSAIYQWARREGVRFANRKGQTLLSLTPETEAKRRAAHVAAYEKIRNRGRNGWTWAELIDLGYTAAQAAKLRGQSVPAAYKAEAVLGRKFHRAQLEGLDQKTRRRLYRVQHEYGVSRNEALEIIGRKDLIQDRAPARARIAAMAKRNPEAAMLLVMSRATEATV